MGLQWWSVWSWDRVIFYIRARVRQNLTNALEDKNIHDNSEDNGK